MRRTEHGSGCGHDVAVVRRLGHLVVLHEWIRSRDVHLGLRCVRQHRVRVVRHRIRVPGVRAPVRQLLRRRAPIQGATLSHVL
jgi:hypothetical protein